MARFQFVNDSAPSVIRSYVTKRRRGVAARSRDVNGRRLRAVSPGGSDRGVRGDLEKLKFNKQKLGWLQTDSAGALLQEVLGIVRGGGGHRQYGGRESPTTNNSPLTGQ